MDIHDVHRLVRQNRVVKSPRYHAHRRGLSFVHVVAALERCYAVRADTRRDSTGAVRHADGYYALTNMAGGRRLRIEFDALQDEHGHLILVVTAYTV